MQKYHFFMPCPTCQDKYFFRCLTWQPRFSALLLVDISYQPVYAYFSEHFSKEAS